MNIVIAGTGILGRNLIRLYLERGDRVRALSYSPRDFQGLEHPALTTVACDVTRPETLARVCNGMDFVISCIGITRMKNNLTHMDVDFQGNLNLLREAEKAGVKKFGFISPAGVEQGWKKVPLLEAKYRFEEELKKSSVPWLIFRSGGFFSDIARMGKTAQKGPLFVIGRGRNYFTPVDVRDLADVMVADMDKLTGQVVNVGGPEELSWNEICRACFDCYGKKPWILKFPKRLCELSLGMLKPFAKSQYAMGKLLVFMSTVDLPTDKRGTRRLADVLRESA
jgi:uncharacterized protein YbjT (DUF2867 family)